MFTPPLSRSKVKHACAALFVVLVAAPPPAQAALIPYGSRAIFEAQGTIAQNYGFEDWGSSGGFSGPGDPYIAHGVTYTTNNNLIAKPDSVYGPASNVFLNNLWSPLPGSISGAYNMFGFDLGVLGSDSLIDYSLTTNIGTYNFNNVAVPNVNQGMTFFGFIAVPGETFTGFNFVSQLGAGHAPALDNVTLGTQGDNHQISEPASLALLSIGLAGVATARRRKIA
jgi:hypothetical protein